MTKPSQRLTQLKPWARVALREYTSDYIARESGVAKTRLDHIIYGHQCRQMTADKLMAFLERHGRKRVLKSCPFCSSEDVRLTGQGKCFFVRCTDCFARTDDYDNPEEAKAGWNQRVNSETEENHE